ncbi:hypothetical protein VTN77DRAFT_8287 [Rasamsonia byssochlamydoides]|uniref:uncharacterized protein n=1 Tax=Rasamsonia byssochlamydoides TaxID=89139 RepID=UPI003743946A
MSIGIAIIGSGIFAREEHLPAVLAAKELTLKAIYSRSLKSAQSLASGFSDVDLYSEDSGPGKSYADLLARQDIKAVIIGLPIPIQPDFIRKALSAGKHVLSEKPIAKDLATAQDLVQWYHSNIDSKRIFWGVAENFRYFTQFLYAAQQVQKLGRVKNFRVNSHTMTKTDFKYYLTEWRKVPEYQGGFVLDGGIHIVAGLRLLLGPEDPIVTLSAHTNLLQEHLPPVDTVDAIVKTKSGATGTFSASYGSDFKDFGFELSCEGGVVSVSRDGVFLNGENQNIPHDGKGVVPEVADFAASIAKGGPLDRRQWPEEALADLEILEKMLRSGEMDGEKMQLSLQVYSNQYP